MRLILSAALLLASVGVAAAGTVAVPGAKLRFADAAADACLASCDSENSSCKRICPTTFGTPCLTSCDSRPQTFRQTFQKLLRVPGRRSG